MSKLKRFLNNQVKDRVKQNIKEPIMAADCCYFCKRRGILYGHYSDAVYCSTRERHVRHIEICDMFKKRGKEE